MLLRLTILFVVTTLITIRTGFAAEKSLPRSTPEEQGVSSEAISAFLDALAPDTLHSFMLVRHGKVIAEGWWGPYDAGSRHMLFSLSKSFTSTAVGLAVAEGKLSIDDPVLKFFPDDVPAEPSSNLKSMRVSDLLRMNTGHQTEPPRKPDEVWTKVFLAHPVPFKPGTHFLYNTSATYMQSAVVQKATGQTLIDYLQPRLFEPLGIEHPTWEASPQGISTGGYGLSVRTEDIAKFGQLYLQKGKWNGQQLVPEAWIEAATARQSSNGSNPASDWDQGYGYQFWRCRNGAYRGDGAFGQYCVVMPEHDAVIAITSGLRDMQSVLNHVWEKLLPGMRQESLPANSVAAGKLSAQLRGLTLTPVSGSEIPASVVGKKYAFPTNDRKLESVTLNNRDGACEIVARFDGIDRSVLCDRAGWRKSRIGYGTYSEQPAAATGAWTGDQFLAKIAFVETPYVLTIKVKPQDSGVEYQAEANVGFGATKHIPLTGKAE